MHKSDTQRLSPAARSLLDSLDQAGTAIPSQGPSVLELRSRGQEPILQELVEAAFAIISDRGHVVSVSALQRMGEWCCARERTTPLVVAGLADEWSISRGRCKSILSALVREGRLVKREGEYTCVSGLS